MHKDATMPPGRPIVNGVDLLSARLDQYIDIHSEPRVVSTKAYLKDTEHILQILDKISTNGQCFLVIADVGSLYTIIGHQVAMESVTWGLRSSDLTRRH